MKMFMNSQSVLGKIGIALTFVLPTIGFAEYGGNYSTAISSSSQPNSALEDRVKVLRDSQEVMEGVGNWQKLHDKNGQYEKAIKGVRARTAEEVAAEDARLDKIQRTMKGINLSGLDQAVQAMASMFNGVKRKECKQPLDFSNMFRMSQGMKDFVGQLTSNFGKQSKEAQEDIQAKAARLAAEENARQEKLEQENPAEAQYKKEYAELDQAAKDPKKLVEYMKKQITTANANQTDSIKKNTRLLNRLLNSPTGLVNLLGAIQKDQELFTEFGTAMMNAASGTFTGILGQGQTIVADLETACDENLSGVKQVKAQLDPVMDKFNNQNLAKKNKALLARAVKADCSTKPDLAQVRNAVTGAETQMRNSLANNDPAGFVQAFAQGPQLMQDALTQFNKPAKDLGKACDTSGNWLDFFKKDQNTQGLKQAAETGDMSQAVQQQDPSQGGQQPAQAAAPVRNQPTFATPGGIK